MADDRRKTTHGEVKSLPIWSDGPGQEPSGSLVSSPATQSPQSVRLSTSRASATDTLLSVAMAIGGLLSGDKRSSENETRPMDADIVGAASAPSATRTPPEQMWRVWMWLDSLHPMPISRTRDRILMWIHELLTKGLITPDDAKALRESDLRDRGL